MDYSKPYQSNLSKIIARLIPYFTRGRKLFYLVYGSMQSLTKIHNTFLSWAHDRFYDVKTPFVRIPMQKLLKKYLIDYLQDPDDEFVIEKYFYPKYGIKIYLCKDQKKEFDYNSYFDIFGGELHKNNILFYYSESLIVDEYYNTYNNQTSNITADSYFDIFGGANNKNDTIYSYRKTSGDPNNKFNIIAPNYNPQKITEKDYKTAIKKIISQYTLIRKYNIY